MLTDSIIGKVYSWKFFEIVYTWTVSRGLLTWNVYVDSVCTKLVSGALAKYCPMKYRQRRIIVLFIHIFFLMHESYGVLR